MVQCPIILLSCFRVRISAEKSLPFSGDKKGEEICMDKRILNEGGRKGVGSEEEWGSFWQCLIKSKMILDYRASLKGKLVFKFGGKMIDWQPN